MNTIMIIQETAKDGMARFVRQPWSKFRSPNTKLII